MSKFSVAEWEGILAGMALPGDIKVGESLAAYLARTVGTTAPRPIGWAVLADNGNIRIWWSDKEEADLWVAKHGGELVRLVNSRVADGNLEIKAALSAALEYIDALPNDIELPVMPGFDRDWAEGLLQKDR